MRKTEASRRRYLIQRYGLKQVTSSDGTMCTTVMVNGGRQHIRFEIVFMDMLQKFQRWCRVIIWAGEGKQRRIIWDDEVKDVWKELARPSHLLGAVSLFCKCVGIPQEYQTMRFPDGRGFRLAQSWIACLENEIYVIVPENWKGVRTP